MENTEFRRDLNVCDDATVVLVPEGTFMMGSEREAVLALWRERVWDQRWFDAQVGADHWVGEQPSPFSIAPRPAQAPRHPAMHQIRSTGMAGSSRGATVRRSPDEPASQTNGATIRKI